jgi:hypothetical protein
MLRDPEVAAKKLESDLDEYWNKAKKDGAAADDAAGGEDMQD